MTVHMKPWLHQSGKLYWSFFSWEFPMGSMLLSSQRHDSLLPNSGAFCLVSDRIEAHFNLDRQNSIDLG